MPKQLWIASVVALLAANAIAADAPANSPEETPAQRGYRWLTTKPYLPPDFDEETFAEVWRAWPEGPRQRAEQASAVERRQMAFERYGLTPRPENPNLPLQYVVDDQGQWTMNCFACHGGQVAGKVIPGLPNSNYALQTLSDEIRAAKIRLKKPLGRMDVGSLFMPLGRSNGTTNAVMFGVILLAHRDAELNVFPLRPNPPMTHHDMDAPPWWQYHRKTHIYIDGFAEKGHRALMQFMLVKQNGPEKFREWERDFEDVQAYLESLRPPKYPFPIDRDLAARGEKHFRQNCASCHGVYGDQPEYKPRVVPLEEVATDPTRLTALTKPNRQAYAESWFAHFGAKHTTLEPAGYVAPPLDGVWASAPYLHNGSVPTLWHLLRPSERPAVWKRAPAGYDSERVGLEITTHDKVPPLEGREQRTYFDTRLFGKSAAGHVFPDALDEDEKRELLEYLKTL